MRTWLALATLAATFALVGTDAASANDGWFINRQCSQDGSHCFWQGGRPSNTGIAKIITVPRPTDPLELAEQIDREIEWARVCKPFPVRDYEGITRMTYSRACPQGVIVGDGRRPPNVP